MNGIEVMHADNLIVLCPGLNLDPAIVAQLARVIGLQQDGCKSQKKEEC